MGVVENMKDMADLVKKVGDRELYRKIVELEGEVLDLTREKRLADQRIEKLEEALKFKEKLTYKAPYYWLDGDPDPYCSNCWSTEHVAVHVIKMPTVHGYSLENRCPSCQQLYPENSY